MKTAPPNKLYVGDNLDVMRGMNSAGVDLIYLDPPFNSKRIYSSPIGVGQADPKTGEKKVVQAKFDDIWVWDEETILGLESYAKNHPVLFGYIQLVGEIHSKAMKAYLVFMAIRMLEIHRILKDSGSLYLHCDPTANSYLRLLLDYVFGKANMRNEIVWGYRAGGAGKKRWAKKHDSLLYYAKTAKSAVFALQKETIYYDKPFFGGETADASGKYPMAVIKRDIWDSGSPGDDEKLKPVINVSKERLGYPTQKPLALLRRIILASSNEGDLVMDPFCGCATTCVAAHELKRNWIGVDLSDVAVKLVKQRLTDAIAQGMLPEDQGAQVGVDFDAYKTPPHRTDQQPLDWNKERIRQHFYKLQGGNCNGCNTHFDSARHFHIDHIFPKSKGGAEVVENLQLLCGHCNSVKGNRPMEYLNAYLKNQNAQIQYL